MLVLGDSAFLFPRHCGSARAEGEVRRRKWTSRPSCMPSAPWHKPVLPQERLAKRADPRTDHRLHHDDRELSPHGGRPPRVLQEAVSDCHRRDRSRPAAPRRRDRDLGRGGAARL